MAGTEQRLIEAAISELVESGFHGATTKAIADRAGVNEVTLFRRFGTKADLMRAAIETRIGPFRSAVFEMSGNLVTDLETIAARFVAFLDANSGLAARLFSELATRSEMRDFAIPIQQGVAERLGDVFDAHQRQGDLVVEDRADALREFMGPLAVRPLMAHLLAPGAFDAKGYVARYLDGRRIPR